MKILITGGGGFLGNRLARALLQRGSLVGSSGGAEAIDELLLFDRFIAQETLQGMDLARVRVVTGDIADGAVVDSLIDEKVASVFHLASVVSGEGERDFDLAMRVNLDGGRHLFEALRRQAGLPRVVFASSLAAFGGPSMPATVGDETKLNPQTTYGMTKVIGELMIHDYSRKGFFDGRAARLPTVVIRPGKPNAAASSFASGLFREPLNGQECELPVGRDQLVPVISYQKVIGALISLHEAHPDELNGDRVFTLPSLSLRIAEMIEALEKVAARRGIALGRIVDRPDPVIEKIICGWPTATDGSRAVKIGVEQDQSMEEIIEGYLNDFGGPVNLS